MAAGGEQGASQQLRCCCVAAAVKSQISTRMCQPSPSSHRHARLCRALILHACGLCQLAPAGALPHHWCEALVWWLPLSATGAWLQRGHTCPVAAWVPSLLAAEINTPCCVCTPRVCFKPCCLHHHRPVPSAQSPVFGVQPRVQQARSWHVSCSGAGLHGVWWSRQVRRYPSSASAAAASVKAAGSAGTSAPDCLGSHALAIIHFRMADQVAGRPLQCRCAVQQYVSSHSVGAGERQAQGNSDQVWGWCMACCGIGVPN